MGKINEETLDEIRSGLIRLEEECRSVGYNDFGVEVEIRVPDPDDVDQDILNEVDVDTVRGWRGEIENLQSVAQDLLSLLEDAYDATEGLENALYEAQEQKDTEVEVGVGDTVKTQTGNEAFVLAVANVYGKGQFAWISATLPDGMGFINDAPTSVTSESLEVVELASDREARNNRSAAVGSYVATATVV